MKLRLKNASITWLLMAAAPALPQTAVPSRGELLYGNHCGACHTTQMHWRDKRVATDWASLAAQVRHWQGELQLNWNDADVDEVARFLNERIYRFPRPGALGSAPGVQAPRS